MKFQEISMFEIGYKKPRFFKARKKIELSDFKELFQIFKKIIKRVNVNNNYRISAYTKDYETIQKIINDLRIVHKSQVQIKELSVEFLIDLTPVLVYLQYDNTEDDVIDFHQNCLDISIGDIVFNYRDNFYYVYTDAFKACHFGECLWHMHNNAGVISKMDLRKASSVEIESYNLDKLARIYSNVDEEEYNSCITILENTPRIFNQN